MCDHFIKNIEIEGYKCFDNFKVSGFNRVNLIGGKNNIGKTVLLESLYLNTQASKQFVAGIRHIGSKRFDQNPTRKSLPEIYSDILEENIDYTIFSNQGLISFIKKKKKNAFNFDFILKVDNKLFEEKNPFILNQTSTLESLSIENLTHLNFDEKTPTFLLFPNKISAYEFSLFYEKIQINDLEEELTKHLRKFDKDIEQFKIFSDKSIKLKKSGKYFGLEAFGDGTKSYIAMILAIYNCKNGFLMIDELENGIHYTQFDQLWEIILTASKEVNCQVFATTHSKDCIESYGRITKKIAHKDISFITLVKDRKNEITSINYSYDTLQNSLDQDHEVRGW